MAPRPSSLRIAFIHPDLGIGGAERLVVDAALGLQKLGHSVDIFTSHHDPSHCFDETRDGTLRVHHIVSPFPRSVKGKLHILLAHARQLHLTRYLLRSDSPQYDVYFVDQLSTCVPFLRLLAGRRVVFYCHFPDKLLANGEFVEGKMHMRGGWLKRVYRLPMDWLEEVTTRQADVILANSRFTSHVFKSYFPSIAQDPYVVYPGINLSAYESKPGASVHDIEQLTSERPTLLSLNRFEKKKNVALAIQSFFLLRKRLAGNKLSDHVDNLRLVIAGGYDPRLENNMMTLVSLLDLAKLHSLTYNIISPSSSPTSIPPFNCTANNPDILLLLNFTTAQRSALLNARSTRALLYTPTNEHFGIGPVEAMACGLPVLACNTGGPIESVLEVPEQARTGWLRPPDADQWASALMEIMALSDAERTELGERAKIRARELFGMDAMAKTLDDKLQEAAAMGPISSYSLRTFTSFLVLLFSILLAVVYRLLT